MKTSYRKGTILDLDEIFSFVEESKKKMISEGILQWDEIYPCKFDFEDDIKRGELTCVIDEATGKISCIYVVNSEFDDAYNSANWIKPDSNFRILHRIVVNPEFQNQGLGTSVMIQLLENLKKEGVESLRLDVFSENPYSLKMYEKLGFKKTGEAVWRKGLFYLMEKII